MRLSRERQSPGCKHRNLSEGRPAVFRLTMSLLAFSCALEQNTEKYGDREKTVVAGAFCLEGRGTGRSQRTFRAVKIPCMLE